MRLYSYRFTPEFRRKAAVSIFVGIGLFVLTWVFSPGSISAQKNGDFSPQATKMRDAASAAGVLDIYLPQATPGEARARKVSQAPWESKVTSIVRDRMRVLQREMKLRPRSIDATAFSTEELFIDNQARLRVEVKVDDDSVFDEGYFASIGGELVQKAEGYGLVIAWVPVAKIREFAMRPDVRLILHINPPYADIGSVTSEGDAIHNADLVRQRLGFNGAGQTVGVISDGVPSLAVAQGTGDAPAGVTVPAGCVGSGDEGTGMLEIVYDLATGANFAFCTGFPGAVGMVNAIVQMTAAGATIITDDLPHPGEPLFEDGPIAQAKQAAVAAGIFYTCSAGNRGNQHYENFFNGGTSNVTIGPNTYNEPHDFGGGDYRLQVSLRTSNSLYLQWADLFGSSGNDFEFYVVDNAGNILASSTNTQNGSQDPNENVNFGMGVSGVTAHIIVDYVGGGSAPAVFFDLRAFGGFRSWEYLIPQGSMNGASRQTAVYTAAAADQSNPNTVNGFSSRGPIRHFFPAPLTRMEPDGTAIDGVLITGAGNFGAGTCPIVNPGDVCRFGGTSAATPHIAGIAALLLQSQPGLTPAQVKTVLNSTAIDIDAPGVDNNAGAGRVDALAAICSFDAGGPTITAPASIVLECNEHGGVDASDPAVQAFLAGGSAVDDLDNAPDLSVSAPGFFPMGATNVTWTATDVCGNVSQEVRTVTVVDTEDPTITCPPLDITVECTQHGGTPATHPEIAAFLADVSATDVCDPDPEITNDAPAFFDLGETVVTFTATDNSDNTDTCQKSVFIVDTTPPVITAEVDPDALWPPNHKLVDIAATVEVEDICDPAPTFVLTSITSNEPINGPGDGNTKPDWVAALGTPDVDFELRAERAGGGDGRKYTIIYTASDLSGNTATDTACVTVTHDQSGSAMAANGFSSDGTMLTTGSDTYALVIPSVPGGFDATGVNVRHAYVGNTKGALLNTGSAVFDANGDGHDDLVLYYPSRATDRLRLSSAADDALGGETSWEDGTLPHGPIGLHYRGPGNTDYLVSDIFVLGSPIEVEPLVLASTGLEDEDTGTQDEPSGKGTDEFTELTLTDRLDTPTVTEMSSIYPNPFNPTTTVGFNLKGAENVNLRVYDAAGVLVRTLKDEHYSPGYHEVFWDGRDNNGQQVSTGVYFIRLIAGDYVEARKAVLLK